MNTYRSLSPEFIQPAAVLFSEAFEKKFRYLLGPVAVLQQIIPPSLNQEQVIAVVSDRDELLGIAGFSYKQQHMLSLSVRTMRKQYGLLQGLYKLIRLGIYFPEETPSDYLYIDAITVKAASRGQGISSLLFRELEQIAAEKGVRQLQLDVAADNVSAIRAYEHMGFRHLSSRKLSPRNASRIGMNEVHRMMKVLD